MTIPEKFIREAARKGQIKYSNHAQLRMGERKIPRLLIDNAILNGEVLEIQNFPEKDVKVVFQSIPGTNDDFYVIVAASYPQVVVVSVCYFMEEVWEELGNLYQRREKR